MQAQQMMTWMYGPGGMNAYVGAVDANHVATAAGANDALMKQLVASAKADQDLLGQLQPVKATASQLPKQRLAGWFVQIDQVATSLAAYAKAFGMPINFQVPANLAPLGGTFSTEGSRDPPRRLRSDPDASERHRRRHADLHADAGRAATRWRTGRAVRGMTRDQVPMTNQ
jgi:hypothetical protein